MKKIIITSFLAAISCFGFSQNLLTYRINAKVLLSNGDSIPTGAVCSFSAHVDNVGTTGKIAYGIDWYYSAQAKTNQWDKVYACSSSSNRTGTRILNWYQTVTDPTQVSYATMLSAIKTYLEGVYGVGNVEILQ